MTDYYQEKCEMVIEPGAVFRETCPLLMTATVVDINCGATQMVRILNHLNESISIRQNSNVGYAEPFISLQTIMEMEDEGEVNNICCVRQVKSQNETINSLSANFQNDPKMELSDKSNVSVPSHLEGLYKEAVNNCNEEEKRKVTNLLVKYQDVFSKHEYDLRLRKGHTRLTHSCLLKREERPYCIGCDTPFTVRHFLLDCADFNRERRSLFSSKQLEGFI